jgi:hypothetical protein
MTKNTAPAASVARLGNVSRPMIIGWVVVDRAAANAHVGEPFPVGNQGERDAQNTMRKLNQGGLLTRYAVDAILA